jgi:uncharacterized RDD family membrane protein YckC
MRAAAEREEMFQATGTDGVLVGGLAEDRPGAKNELQREVAERLAAHRSRRAAEQVMKAAFAENAMEREAAHKSRGGAASVRAAVQARYEQSVSYREFLAAEADRVLERAQAEAEVAARKVKAVAEAQMQLMQELEQMERPPVEPEPSPREVALADHKIEMRGELAHALADIVLGAKELIFESAGPVVVPAMPKESDPELAALESEIEFRLAPEFGPHLFEAEPIAGNLIEFPRQLIAPRKARPRLAEGPLRADAPLEPQLRIFEVEPEQIAVEPAAAAMPVAPEWQGLLLSASHEEQPQAQNDAQHHFALQPQTATLGRRSLAAATDVACIAVALAAFVGVALELTGLSLRDIPKPLAAGVLGGVAIALMIGYQMLFFSLSGATPGMRYARLGLCTFGDRNPSRKQMRRRVFATLLAACPLGLGLAWAWMDGERLGWHDRMSRMYLRAY